MPKCPNCNFQWGKKTPEHNRSNPQNSYFHAVVIPILSEYTGYDHAEIKGIVKYKFKVKHTSDLSTVEFEKFMSDVRMWASRDLGCYVPSPNEHKTII
jgi:hypothetical protein